MRAYLKNIGQNSWGIRETILPVVTNKDEVLVKVLNTGICGSDLNRIRLNILDHEHVALGHEFGGIVIDSKISTDIGRKVVVNPILSCNTCAHCKNGYSQFCASPILIGKNRSGSFGEFVLVPRRALYDCSEKLNEELYCLIDGVAVAHNLLRQTKDYKAPDNILIIGDGTIGAVSSLILAHNYPDAKIFLDGKHSSNLEVIANAIGAQYGGLDSKDDYECIVETVGRSQAETLDRAIKKASIGGKIYVLGVFDPGYEMLFDPRSTFYKELKIIGVNSFIENDHTHDFGEALAAVSNHQSTYKTLITACYNFDSIQQAINESFAKPCDQ